VEIQKSGKNNNFKLKELEMNLGIVRKMDELGRIVIPKELRDKYDLEEGTEIEIFAKDDEIILRKYKDTFCPKCLTRCEHTDVYCRNCGLKFTDTKMYAKNMKEEQKNDC